MFKGRPLEATRSGGRCGCLLAWRTLCELAPSTILPLLPISRNKPVPGLLCRDPRWLCLARTPGPPKKIRGSSARSSAKPRSFGSVCRAWGASAGTEPLKPGRASMTFKAIRNPGVFVLNMAIWQRIFEQDDCLVETEGIFPMDPQTSLTFWGVNRNQAETVSFRCPFFMGWILQ